MAKDCMDCAGWRLHNGEHVQKLISCRQFIDQWVAIMEKVSDRGDPLGLAFTLAADKVLKMSWPVEDHVS